MAFSWFAEHKLPCNWFPFLLANEITPVGGDCLLLSVGRDATICKTVDLHLFEICKPRSGLVSHNTITMNKYEINIHPELY